MEIRDYVNLLARHYLVIIATAVVGIVAAGAFCVIATPEYTANAKVVFTGHGGPGGRDLAYAASFAQSRVQTYKSVATTPAVLNPVIAKLKLDTTDTELAKRVTVEASQISTLVKISVADSSPKLAAAIADNIAGSLVNTVTGIERSSTTTPSITGEVVGPASTPKHQSSPKVVVYLIIGAILGLLVSIAVLALRESIRTPPRQPDLARSNGT